MAIKCAIRANTITNLGVSEYVRGMPSSPYVGRNSLFSRAYPHCIAVQPQPQKLDDTRTTELGPE